MKNNEVETWHILIFMLLATFMIYMIYNKPQIAYDDIKTNCKEDSLQSVISNLQGTLETEENGWDSKEERYESILFEYEYGLSRLKETHPEAYKEFHRIISFREKYSREDEKDNKKRLKTKF